MIDALKRILLCIINPLKSRNFRISMLICIMLFILEHYLNFFSDLKLETQDRFCTEKIKFDQIYLLNLDKSTDRLERVTKELEKHQVTFYRWRAIYGYDLTLTDIKTNQIIPGITMKNNPDFFKTNKSIFKVSYKGLEDLEFTFDNTNPLFKKTYVYYFDNKDPKEFKITCAGELGCAYSHLSIWRDIVKNNYNIVAVFEDDIFTYPGFKKTVINISKNIPEDADIIFLSIHNANPRKLYRVKNNKYLLKINTLFTGTYSYIITNKGAKKLLSKLQNINVTIDLAIATLVKNKQIVAYVSKKDLCYNAPEYESEIRATGEVVE